MASLSLRIYNGKGGGGGGGITAIAIKPAKPLRIIPAAIFCGNKQPFALVGLEKGFESVQQP